MSNAERTKPVFLFLSPSESREETTLVRVSAKVAESALARAAVKDAARV